MEIWIMNLNPMTKKRKKNSKIKVVVAIVPKGMMVPCFQVVSAGSLNNPRVIFLYQELQ